MYIFHNETLPHPQQITFVGNKYFTEYTRNLDNPAMPSQRLKTAHKTLTHQGPTARSHIPETLKV